MMKESTTLTMTSMQLDQHVPVRPLRILMVTGIYPTKQRPHKGTFIKSQIDSLIEAGMEVEIIHPKPGPVFVRYLSAVLQVLRKTRSGRFDLVHGHYGQWCLFARLQWTTPVIASFLGNDLFGTPKANGKMSRKGTLVVHLSRWLCRHVDAIIVKSEPMRKVVSAGTNRVFVIPNGVDFTLFHPIPRAEARAALHWDQDRYYILFGNNPNIPVKNFSLAQAAMKRLQEKGIAAELVVANGLPQSTVVQYINASNVLILPSISEGSPNIVKETMACNVPVVATAVGDVSQVIGRTRGCSVCPHDPDALASALELALQHPEPTTGRNDIAHLEKSVIATQVLAIYEEIINKHLKKKR